VHKVYGRIKEGLKNFEHSEFVIVLKDTHIKLYAKVPSEREFSNESINLIIVKWNTYCC
jgi:hypothetical protein